MEVDIECDCEQAVKTMDLSGFKVLAFATHGLVPGELNGLTQPALALSAPGVAGVEGDGLLTMEEILALKLDADWVVLSACNTGAGSGAGAEAASGLGRAFFYAGTRALLVTNWSVHSQSARELVTDLFRRQAADKQLSRGEAGFRAVPGSIVRRGAFISKGAVLMPSFVNIGAYVDSGTMVDTWATVGSCAQIGKNGHLSASAQVGGVLEPIHMSPVIIEDNVFVGALCGVFEGFIVRERAVLATGVTLTAATVVYDLVNGTELRGEIPPGAVVVPGTRPASGTFAADRGLQVAAPMIVKYRDERTDAATALESALR